MSRYLIEQGDERQNVTSLAGYEDWTIVGEAPDEIPDHEAELVDGTWALPMDIARARRWKEIKQIRDAVMHGGCQTPLGRMDTDVESQGKITGAATMAQLAGSTFVISWTMADNTAAVHNQAAMINAAMAVGAFVSGCHAAGRRARAQIDSAYFLTDLGRVEFVL